MAVAPTITPLGPESLAWQHAGDNLQLLVAVTTLVLQVAHPVVGAGVDEHSTFKTDPWGRLQRTTEWGLRLLYGGASAPAAGQDLRNLHRPIKGTDKQGRQYFALDPEAYAWVHMTTYYALVKTQELFGDRPFTPTEAAQLYAEWRQQGRVLGIREQDMPATPEAFWLYLDTMVRERLEVTEIAQYLLQQTLTRSKRPPQLRWLPKPLWDRLYAQVGNVLMLCGAASMTAALREKFDVAWGVPEQKRFRRLQWWVRRARPLIPMKLRYLPPAYLALTGRWQHRLAHAA